MTLTFWSRNVLANLNNEPVMKMKTYFAECCMIIPGFKTHIFLMNIEKPTGKKTKKEINYLLISRLRMKFSRVKYRRDCIKYINLDWNYAICRRSRQHPICYETDSQFSKICKLAALGVDTINHMRMTIQVAEIFP